MNGRQFYDLFQSKWNEQHSVGERMSKAKAEAYCRAMMEVFDEQFNGMAVGDKITFYGFGTFSKRERAPRIIGNIRTGEKMELPAKEFISFLRSENKR
jgi:nucleoid DNA-binding protein